MARKKPAPAELISFDVVYEDGAQSSNRRVPSDIDGGLEDLAAVKAFLAAQDRKLAELSGRPRGTIKSVKRSAGR
ncbi:MAG: hypothetical protein U1E53_34535 [Dongiaceae bacterium]